MKTLATSLVVLTNLCAPALAAPATTPIATAAAPSAPPMPPPPTTAPLKIRFSLRDVTTTDIDLVIGAANRCATATEKHTDRELQLHACVAPNGYLELDWSTRSSWGEYRSMSSVPATPGTTSELGMRKGPRLTVEIQ